MRAPIMIWAGLPMSTNWKGTSYDLILVVIDRLTKMIHYEPVQIPIDIPGLAKVFIDLVIRYHGLPNSIVSDRNSVFTSKFWSPRYHF